MTYQTGDGAGLTKHLVHSVTDPIAAHGQRVKKETKRQAREQEHVQRQKEFADSQHEKHVQLTNVQHSHAMAEKQADHSHEATMLKLAHTMHRNTVRSERKAGVVEGNTTFSTPTVQANGGHRRFAEPEKASSPAPAAAKPATPKSPTSRATKPVTIGSKQPRATKAQQKPAGSTSVHFQAP
jgi:hypothetical protein